MKEKLVIPIILLTLVVLSTLGLLFSVKAGLAIFASGVLVGLVFMNPFTGLMIYLSMIYLRPQEFVAALKGQPLVLIMALVVLSTLVIHNAFQKKKFLFSNFRQGFFMLAFFVVIIMSQLQLLYLSGARKAFDDFLPVFMLFFMIVNLITSFDQLRKTFLLLIILTALISADGIYQYFHGIDIAGQTLIEGRIRWIGIFSDPNDLGLTILAFTPFPLIFLFKKKSSAGSRLFWFVILAVLLYALYLTNSRGTFLGLMAILAYFSIKKWGWTKGLVGGVAAAMALFAMGPSRMSELSLQEASASGRIDAWATGINLLKWRPVLGVGYGNFTEHHTLTAHNSVVLCWSELGLVGLFVWLLLIVTSFNEMLIAEKRARGTEVALLAQGMQLSMIGFFVSAFFLSRTYNEVLYIIIALCTLLSYFARKSLGYSVKFLRIEEIGGVIAFGILLIIIVKVFVIMG